MVTSLFAIHWSDIKALNFYARFQDSIEAYFGQTNPSVGMHEIWNGFRLKFNLINLLTWREFTEQALQTQAKRRVPLYTALENVIHLVFKTFRTVPLRRPWFTTFWPVHASNDNLFCWNTQRLAFSTYIAFHILEIVELEF